MQKSYPRNFSTTNLHFDESQKFPDSPRKFHDIWRILWCSATLVLQVHRFHLIPQRLDSRQGSVCGEAHFGDQGLENFHIFDTNWDILTLVALEQITTTSKLITNLLTGISLQMQALYVKQLMGSQLGSTTTLSIVGHRANAMIEHLKWAAFVHMHVFCTRLKTIQW